MTPILFALLTVRPATLPDWMFAIGAVLACAAIVKGWRMRGRGE